MNHIPTPVPITMDMTGIMIKNDWTNRSMLMTWDTWLPIVTSIFMENKNKRADNAIIVDTIGHA